MKIEYDAGSSPVSGAARKHTIPYVEWDAHTITLCAFDPPRKTRDMEMLAYRMNTVARDHSLPFHVIVSYRQMYVVPHADQDDPIPFQRDETGALAVTITR